ncbi:hypothetical protein STEG23_007677 [Scotinomys teguina]
MLRYSHRFPITSSVGRFKISKVIVVGDLSVGKTCLINRFCKDTFDKNYKATIGVDFEMERFEVLGVPFSLQLWDTAGQERFKCIASTYYRGAQAIIIVFNLNDVASLEHTKQWLADALKENDPSNVLLFLVGSKKDLSTPAQYALMEKDALKVAQEIKAEYWAVSSLTGENVREFFFRVAALTFEANVLAELEKSGSRRIGDVVRECTETDRCCWKHQQCAGHIIYPFLDCGHHNWHMHAVSHCDCESRTDDVHEKEEEEVEEILSSIPSQLCPTAIPTDPDIRSVTRTPDSAAPITIWRSESPTEKSQEDKVIKKIKKKKEKEKDKEDEMVDEKTKPKKKAKGKVIKKSPVKSESSPPDLSRSISPRVRTSESSPESREELESEDSYHRGKEEPSSEDIVESSPKKREKNTSQAKKNGTKTIQTRKTSKKKSPLVSNPNFS